MQDKVNKKKSDRRYIIAIDGPSAAGKSTVGRLLAKHLGYLYVDTGAMYRGLAWKFLQLGVNLNDETGLKNVCRETSLDLAQGEKGIRVYVDHKDVTDEIRTPEVGMMTSKISPVPVVRERLLQFQRKMAEKGGLVMEGRDIGTVVFPNADLKFFLDADPEVRGKRRYLEYREKGISIGQEETLQQIEERDRLDRERKHSPLRCAEDAIRIDSTELTVEKVIERMVQEIGRYDGGNRRNR